MRGTLEQARMDVKNIAGEGFASGRTAQQQGQLTIGARVLGQVVVHDQHVASCLHEIFGDAGRGVRRDIGEAGRVVALGDHHDCELQRALLAQNGHRFRDGRRTLADRAIHTHDVLSTLIENRVDCNRSFSGLAVAQDQLALTAPDRNQCIDHLQT